MNAKNGSSPLTRGKPVRRSRSRRRRRLIPAHAGKTPLSSAWSGKAWAHPRSRGENRAFDVLAVGRMGSSPLTRGKLDAEGPPALRGRLIPAHAGKTHPTQHQRRTAWAHPRSRGENASATPCTARTRGSSPLTRGKHGSISRAPVRRGLIPAHAGKTLFSKTGSGWVRAHPRSRGENAAVLVLISSWSGSSPLTRGKLACETDRIGLQRLIPAHAGKTRSVPRLPLMRTAHPRSRGENSVIRSVPVAVVGSSPLTRGKRSPLSRRSLAWRLIPAHAGKTSRRGCPLGNCAAHPRSRGENAVRRIEQNQEGGSSPLTRGKRLGVARISAVEGLIPAHAGKTITHSARS